MNSDPELTALLKNSNRVLITTHIYPDGDAAGSACGLATSLRENGTSVDLALTTEVGERFTFIFKNETILKPEQISGEYDAAIILDIGSEDRTGFQDTIRSLGCPRINIDHHVTNDNFAEHNIVDTDASSTCEIIYKLIKEIHLPFNSEVAWRLYVGLLTDSRYFQNDNVRPETFQAAYGLLSTGFDHRPIIRNLVQSRTYLDLKILGVGLSSFKTQYNGKIAMTILRKSDYEPLGANFRHAWSSGIFGYLISLNSALVSVSFVEAENGKTFCEFRAKNGFDVSRIASHFGGGGHKSASGCAVELPIDQISKKVLSYIEREISDFE